MKIVYLAEILIVVDSGEKEIVSSIVDEEFEETNRNALERIFGQKVSKALEYYDLHEKVQFIDDDHFITRGLKEIKMSRSIAVKDASLRSSYIEMTLKPVLKAKGWVFNMVPVKPNVFIDTNWSD